MKINKISNDLDFHKWKFKKNERGNIVKSRKGDKDARSFDSFLEELARSSDLIDENRG